MGVRRTRKTALTRKPRFISERNFWRNIVGPVSQRMMDFGVIHEVAGRIRRSGNIWAMLWGSHLGNIHITVIGNPMKPSGRPALAVMEWRNALRTVVRAAPVDDQCGIEAIALELMVWAMMAKEERDRENASREGD